MKGKKKVKWNIFESPMFYLHVEQLITLFEDFQGLEKVSESSQSFNGVFSYIEMPVL